MNNIQYKQFNNKFVPNLSIIDVMMFNSLEQIKKMEEHMLFIKDKVNEMVDARKVANKIETEREKAIAYHDNVFPLFDEIRYHIDKLELMVDDEIWPLPKYRELLFIR